MEHLGGMTLPRVPLPFHMPDILFPGLVKKLKRFHKIYYVTLLEGGWDACSQMTYHYLERTCR